MKENSSSIRETDEFFIQRRSRRLRKILLAGIPLLAVVCLAAVFYTSFRDTCTHSFDRTPEGVISGYFRAIASEDTRLVMPCWDHYAYYSLDSGCSEICLSHLLGVPLEIKAIKAEALRPTDQGRYNLEVSVEVVCSRDGQRHAGEAVLDTVNAELPWAHWKIIRSTIGGSIAHPWCQP